MHDGVTISTYELLKLFPNEASARVYLEKRRWNGHVHCPHCACDGRITVRKGKRFGYYWCRDCGKEFTVRTDSIFERSHIPLDKWLLAMYIVVTARKGISSLQLSKEHFNHATVGMIPSGKAARIPGRRSGWKAQGHRGNRRSVHRRQGSSIRHLMSDTTLIAAPI